MRYALIGGIRQEATKGAKGQCLCCGADVIAKCGKIRCWHWAHKNNEECPYSKKEPKTQWHLDWQNYFPKEWQEVRCTDEQTGEIHIADIKTTNGLVVEFQHSAINSEERLSRERYHKNMIWVVDGARLQHDLKRFAKNIEKFRALISHNSEIPVSLYTVNWIEEILPKSWLSATVPLYFDFRPEKIDDSERDQQKSLRNLMWGFFRIGKTIFAVSMPHNCFVDYVQREIIRNIEQVIISAFQQKTLQSPAITAPPVFRSPQMVSRRSNSYSGSNARQINRIKSKNPSFRF